jgi:hypothetical protein
VETPGCKLRHPGIWTKESFPARDGPVLRPFPSVSPVDKKLCALHWSGVRPKYYLIRIRFSRPGHYSCRPILTVYFDSVLESRFSSWVISDVYNMTQEEANYSLVMLTMTTLVGKIWEGWGLISRGKKLRTTIDGISLPSDVKNLKAQLKQELSKECLFAFATMCHSIIRKS